MTHLRLLGAVLLLLLLVGPRSQAAPYQQGDSFVGFAGEDQQGTAITFKAGGARFVIFETPGEGGSTAQPSDPHWFDEHQVLLLVNISELNIFKRRIARSRMKAKPFRIVVVDQKDTTARFPQQEGKCTILLLDEKGLISGIRYAVPGKQVQEVIINGGKPAPAAGS